MNYRSVFLLTLLALSVVLVGCDDDDGPVNPPTELGTVRVDVEPGDLEVGWTVAGPDGFTLDGRGDAVLDNVAVGDYHIVWGEAPLWSVPDDAMLTLAVADTVTFAGTYTPLLTNPDLLMNDFKTQQEEKAAEIFPELLDEDFRLNLLPETIQEWAGGDSPLASDHFDAQEFAAIYANIFAGETGLDPNGNPVAPVESIDFQLMEKLGSWETVDPEMEYFGGFAGAYTARYSILVYFNLPGNFRFAVEGQLTFVARPDGPQWRLLGIIPLGRAGKGTESISYDSVLAFYR